MWELKPSFVTFIIPTKGRETLKISVQSLLDQSSWNWRAMILFDGIPVRKIGNFDYLEDNHFVVKECEHKGHAGLVRNEGIPLVDTKWTAFLDDDDFLKSTYTESLMKYDTANPNTDIIIFTYKDMENGNTRPPKNLNIIKCCEVGISFAIRTEFIERTGVRFRPGGLEDWGFLFDCVNAGATYLITHDIQYFVGHRSAWA